MNSPEIMNTLQIIHGDALTTLATLPDNSVHCCVTSPPYFGLRDYHIVGQIGLELTPEEWVDKLVAVFAQIRRILRPDGTLWLNVGDAYNGYMANQRGTGLETKRQQSRQHIEPGFGLRTKHLKPKDLIGLPWLLAFALRTDGWYLRSEITWCKKAPMPESVTDRPTSATEKIFLLSKSQKYWYDADAVRNPPSESMLQQVAEGYNGEATKLFEDAGVQNASDVKSRIIQNARNRIDKQRGHSRRHAGFNDRWDHLTKEEQMACGSNMRNYWLMGPEPSFENHFAAFPPGIPRRCILAGCPPAGTVIDPFLGSGTTALVALELGRSAIGIELNPDYCNIASQRCNVTPGLALA